MPETLVQIGVWALVAIMLSPVFYVAYALWIKSEEFLPSRRGAPLYTADAFSGFLVLSLSLMWWFLLNVIPVMPRMMVEGREWLLIVAYIIVSIAVVRGAKNASSPDRRPLWCPTNWSLVATPACFVLGVFLLLRALKGSSINALNEGQGNSDFMIIVGVFVVVLIFGGLKRAWKVVSFPMRLVGLFVTIALTAHANFSLAGLALGAVSTTADYLDTGVINLMALPDLIMEMVGNWPATSNLSISAKEALGFGYTAFLLATAILKFAANRVARQENVDSAENVGDIPVDF